MRGKPLTTVVDELPSWHSKGGGFSSAALGSSAALPSGTDPRTGQRAPTQEPALQKRRKEFLPGGVLFSPCPGLPVPGLSWFRVAGSPALPLRVSCLFLFRLMFLFYWPRASRSSFRREGRRVKRRGTDPRTGPFQESLFVRRPGVRSFSSYLRCLLYFIIGGFGLPPLAQTFFSRARCSSAIKSLNTSFPWYVLDADAASGEKFLFVSLRLRCLWLPQSLQEGTVKTELQPYLVA